MASRKKDRPLKGNGRDGLDYAEFMAGLLDGSVRATSIVDTTVADGTQQVTLERFAANGQPLADLVVTVPKRRLTKLEFNDPNG